MITSEVTEKLVEDYKIIEETKSFSVIKQDTQKIEEKLSVEEKAGLVEVDKSRKVLSGVPQQQIDSKVLYSDSESAKLGMESGKAFLVAVRGLLESRFKPDRGVLVRPSPLIRKEREPAPSRIKIERRPSSPARTNRPRTVGNRQHKVCVRPFKNQFWWGDAVEIKIKEEIFNM